MGGTPEEIPEVYRARNPILHADRITRPLLVGFSGALSNNYLHKSSRSPTIGPGQRLYQAERIVNTVLRQGGRVDYLFFEPTLPRTCDATSNVRARIGIL